MPTTERNDAVCVVFAQSARHHRNTKGRSRFVACGSSPGWWKIVGEHRRHESLDARPLLLLYPPFGEHGLDRFRRGLDGDCANGSVDDHIGVVGKQLLDEAVHVMTVGEAVMDVEGRVCLSVANGHSKV